MACVRGKRDAQPPIPFAPTDVQTRGRQKRFLAAPTRASARICAILRPRLPLPAATALAIVAVLLGAVLLGGCGSSSSSNGIASKTPTEILSAAPRVPVVEPKEDTPAMMAEDVTIMAKGRRRRLRRR